MTLLCRHRLMSNLSCPCVTLYTHIYIACYDILQELSLYEFFKRYSDHPENSDEELDAVLAKYPDHYFKEGLFVSVYCCIAIDTIIKGVLRL